MSEYPILFSAPMILALLAGRKTQTRRMSEAWMKVKAGDRLWVRETWCAEHECDGNQPPFSDGRPILRTPSDLTDCEWGHLPAWEQMHYRATDKDPDLDCMREGCKRAGDPHCHWSPSIHMPRWASRITLEATEDARRDLLADISEVDAIAEGLTVQIGGGTGPGPGYKWNGPGYSGMGHGSYHVGRADGNCCCHDGMGRLHPAVCAFYELWDSLHGKDAPVSSNPSPVRIAFRVLP